MSEEGNRTDSTRIIVERYAEDYSGDTLRGLAKYLASQRRHGGEGTQTKYEYWHNQVKKYQEEAEAKL